MTADQVVPETTTFRDSILLLAPRWLRNKWGERYLYTIGTHVDGLMAYLQQGVKARFPGVGTNEALPSIGADRVISRGFAETDTAYTARLQGAFDAWHLAGNAMTVIAQLLGYVSPAVPRIQYVCNGTDPRTGVHVATWVTIDPGPTVTVERVSPSNWNWDNDWTHLSRFWIIIYPGVWVGRTWGDGSLWGEGTWGGSASAAQVADVRALIRKWKRAGSMPVSTIVASSLIAPMPDGTWGLPASRDNTAIYWEG